ncbi:hypothetical protein DRQ33_04425 [bacterium]|nr:MAG: hypothetical protein DRQ33_04425 [bacterium]
MRRIIFIVLILSFSLFAGTISGELIYPDGGFGLYIVMAVGSDELAEFMGGADTLDPAEFFMSLPRAELFSPGEFEITGEFTDGVAYTLFGVKIEGTQPASGDPMGLCPEDIFTTGGDARGAIVELQPEGVIGGEITYMGIFPGCKVNVYDMMSGEADLESTYIIDELEYSITVPAGFKTLEFYIDDNGNNQWDPEELEAGAYYMDTSPDGWGPVVFAGGGDRFSDGVNVIIPPSDITSQKQQEKTYNVSCLPSGVIRFDVPEKTNIKVVDLSGRIILDYEISGKGEISQPENYPAGIYLVILDYSGGKAVDKLILVK